MDYSVVTHHSSLSKFRDVGCRLSSIVRLSGTFCMEMVFLKAKVSVQVEEQKHLRDRQA